MKIYFENDPDKQEMLVMIVKQYIKICANCMLASESFKKDCWSCSSKIALKNFIERITGDKIEEVLK